MPTAPSWLVTRKKFQALLVGVPYTAAASAVKAGSSGSFFHLQDSNSKSPFILHWLTLIHSPLSPTVEVAISTPLAVDESRAGATVTYTNSAGRLKVWIARLLRLPKSVGVTSSANKRGQRTGLDSGSDGAHRIWDTRQLGLRRWRV